MAGRVLLLALVAGLSLPSSQALTTCFGGERCGTEPMSACNIGTPNLYSATSVIECHNQKCVDFLSGETSQSTQECLAHMQMVNLSSCPGCTWPSRPLHSFLMVNLTEAGIYAPEEDFVPYMEYILDFSNNRQADYTFRAGFLDGPRENVTILHLTGNSLARLENNEILSAKKLGELWVDSNDVSSLALPQGVSLPLLKFISLRNNPKLRATRVADFRYWPAAFPNIQVIDLGETDIFVDFHIFYPNLVKMKNLDRLYWPERTVACSCPMIRAIDRNMKSGFKILYGNKKAAIHQQSTGDFQAAWKTEYQQPDLDRYDSYFTDVRDVICSNMDSVEPLKGQKLTNFKSLARKRC